MSGDKHNLRVGDYLGYIVTAIEKINRYTNNMDRQGFLDDEKTLDAVAKNLENIGEASKRIQVADAESNHASTSRADFPCGLILLPTRLPPSPPLRTARA